MANQQRFPASAKANKTTWEMAHIRSNPTQAKAERKVFFPLIRLHEVERKVGQLAAKNDPESQEKARKSQQINKRVGR